MMRCGHIMDILKVESTGFANGLDVEGERGKRVKGDAQVFGLGDMKGWNSLSLRRGSY